jgi:predicted DCC family thiol-disulfide oxidoreductase YuxK
MNPIEKETTPAPALTVLYDGSCPLCRREIGLYQSLHPSEPLAWRDVSATCAALPSGTRREDLMARFHVMQADGAVLSGAKAFVALWSTLPGWRWLSRLARLPGATPCLEWIYCRFLVARPWLQKRARAFEKQAGGELR